MKNWFFLKLGIAIVAGFGLLIAGFYFWKPLNIAYYKYQIGSENKEAHAAAVKYLLEADAIEPVKYFYENRYASKDVHERLVVVDELCAFGDKGKKLMYDLFRARCMREQVLIPAGSFMMGSDNGTDDEKPVHKVTLSAFWMDKYEITNEKYYVFERCAKNFKMVGECPKERELHPVGNVSWDDANSFAHWLNMRLPTEAEWEYACRAGSTTDFCYGNKENELEEYAWIANNSGGQTHKIGLKKPNNWGLFDIYGNASEWCKDFYHGKYYVSSPVENPIGPNSGWGHVRRGGNYFMRPNSCSSFIREMDDVLHSDEQLKATGFRVCRSAGK
jgi:formylglycine-generating enzyme required for sulfatase activity